MNPWVAGIAGVFGGLALVAIIAPANEQSCCNRIALAGRGKIAGLAGDPGTYGNTAVATALDVTGLTNALPGLLDLFGVPKG